MDSWLNLTLPFTDYPISLTVTEVYMLQASTVKRKTTHLSPPVPRTLMPVLTWISQAQGPSRVWSLALNDMQKRAFWDTEMSSFPWASLLLGSAKMQGEKEINHFLEWRWSLYSRLWWTFQKNIWKWGWSALWYVALWSLPSSFTGSSKEATSLCWHFSGGRPLAEGFTWIISFRPHSKPMA